MRRNIILFSLTILFIFTTSILNSLIFGNKPEEIEDLEDIQKSANERYITAQILSQKLDNVYRLFEVNLATRKNDSKNEEANVDFINSLTDILFAYEIDIIELKPAKKRKEGKYTLVPYQLEISCDYEKFGEFLVELEKNERLITITEFNYNNSPYNYYYGFNNVTAEYVKFFDWYNYTDMKNSYL